MLNGELIKELQCLPAHMEVCIQTGASCNKKISIIELKSGVIVLKKKHTIKVKQKR